MTTLPTWAVYAVSLGTPVTAFLGVLLAQLITRRGARELERRSRREETMRSLRWAAELAVHRDERMADLGVAQLVALLDSDLLDEGEKVFVEAALDAVYDEPEEAVTELRDDAQPVQFVTASSVAHASGNLPEAEHGGVSSDAGSTEEG